MARYIDADKAVRIVETLSENEDPKYNCYNAEWIIDFLESMPEENVIERDAATIYGYPLKDLRILAEALKTQNVDKNELKKFVTDIGNAIDMARQVFEEALETAIDDYRNTLIV